MSVVNLPVGRPTSDSELEFVAQLATRLSGRLARAGTDDISGIMAEALAQVVAATRVAACRLLEFTDAGVLAGTHFPAHAARERDQESDEASERWFVDRLSAGEVIAIARPEDLPPEAEVARGKARRTGACSILGVPACITGHIVCALVIDSTASPRRWSPALIERLQLLAEILGAALQRGRHEDTLRANVSVIERLNARLEADNVYLKEEIKTYHDFDEIVGESAMLRLALSRLAQVAPTNSSVLLTGPTGTGKELFARALHERSRRHARPLVRVNCAALPPTLVESELFGHEKGAFTGAVAQRLGRFELADGGTHLPRRDRRSDARRAGAVPARAAGGRVRAGRIVADAQGGRAGHRRDPPRPRSVDRRGQVPRRPLLPAQRLPDSPAVAARARRGHPPPGLVLHPPAPARARPPDHQGAAAGDAGAAEPHLARQRARARERGRAGDDRLGRAIRSTSTIRCRSCAATTCRPTSRTTWIRCSAATSKPCSSAAAGGSTASATPPSGSASTRTRCASA